VADQRDVFDEQPKRKRGESAVEFVERVCAYQGRSLPEPGEPPHPTLSAAALKNIRDGRGPGAQERIDAIFEERSPRIPRELLVPVTYVPGPASKQLAEAAAAGAQWPDDEYGEAILAREPGEDPEE
jgi:hypothetical protein